MTIAELDRVLQGTPYALFLGPGGGAAVAMEVAITRSLAQRMRVLARWAGPDARALRPVFIEQDARNIRAILRGVIGGLPSEQRMSSVIPTPLLGRKELEALARAESAGSVAATLAAWRHPLGPALLAEASRKHPDPFRLEASLAHRLANEVSRAARSGGGSMRAFVREELDASNAVAAVLLAAARTEGDLVDFFVEGGSGLGADDFARAASAPDGTTAAELLANATAGTLLAGPLREPSSTAAALSARILEARIGELTRRSRVEPLSAAPVLLFVLRLRREAQLVRRALWAAALTRRLGA